MTLITLGLACPHLGRQPGACTGTHRWLAVIALARWLEPPLPTLWLLSLAALFLWRREPGPRLAAACALALLAGGVRTLWATPHFGPDDLATDNDHGQVTLVGVVVDEPDVRDTYQNLRLRAESLTMESVEAEGAGALIERADAPIGPLRGRPAPTQPASTNRAGAPIDPLRGKPAPTQTSDDPAPDMRPVRGAGASAGSTVPRPRLRRTAGGQRGAGNAAGV